MSLRPSTLPDLAPPTRTTSTPLPIPTSLTLKRDRVVRPYRPLSNACTKASASGPVSQQVIGGTMLKATGAEETTFKKAAGSYKRSRMLVYRLASKHVIH